MFARLKILLNSFGTDDQFPARSIRALWLRFGEYTEIFGASDFHILNS